ncbi:hypothetical protein [Glutamicibacter sp. NPDC087344]|uniref:hypothetical protein n=1 Tax=Glutamicibacter sp. NPDC087344 TaxID=3363994 RepID=UPI003806B575
MLILLFVPIVVIVATQRILGPNLPSITATHWSDSSYPDGFTDSSVLFTASITFAVIGGLVGWGALFLTRKPLALLGLLFVGSLTAWTTAGVYVSSSVPTALAGDPTQAVSGPWIVASILATVISFVPLWLCGVFQQYQQNRQNRRREYGAQNLNKPVKPQAEVPGAAATVPIDGFNVTMNAPWWLWFLGIFTAGLGVFMLVMSAGEGGDVVSQIMGIAVIVLLTPLVLGIARIRVTISNGKLRVASAVLGFPLRTIEVSQMQSVISEEIQPMEWGGWGWRFFPGGSAVVMRRHEGLAVELKDKRRFAVTIPDSARAAAQLNALMAQGR